MASGKHSAAPSIISKQKGRVSKNSAIIATVTNNEIILPCFPSWPPLAVPN
jgi:hypothetical protein